MVAVVENVRRCVEVDGGSGMVGGGGVVGRSGEVKWQWVGGG